jgi:hypothetical protein
VAQGSFYESTDEKADKPYLALYPLEDMAFLKSDEFKTIKVHSDLLPGTGLCYDLADIDIRYYQRVQDFSPNGAEFGNFTVLVGFLCTDINLGQGGGMMVVAVTLGEDTTPEEFDDYYTQQVCTCKRQRVSKTNIVSTLKNYRKSRAIFVRPDTS